MDRNLIDYYPEVLRPYRDIKALAATEEKELSALWSALEKALDNQFVKTCGKQGLKRFENLLGIVPKASDTDAVRRFRILTRFNEQLPYTEKTLHQQLETLCGKGGYTLEVAHDAYKVTARVKMDAEGKYDEVGALLGRILPANMSLDLSLLYNTYAQLMPYTHAQLSAHTHEALRRVNL